MNRESERDSNQEAKEDAQSLRVSAPDDRAAREAERSALARLKRKCGSVKKKARK